MDILQPYQGAYVSAGSASKYLDIEKILKGCDEVDNEAEEIVYVNSKLNSAGSSIDSRALSIDNVTVDNSLVECLESINNVYQNILSETSQVRAAAVNAYNSIQSELNNDASVRNARAREEYQRNQRRGA